MSEACGEEQERNQGGETNHIFYRNEISSSRESSHLGRKPRDVWSLRSFSPLSPLSFAKGFSVEAFGC